MSSNKKNRSKSTNAPKSRIELLVAQYGLLGAVIAACIGATGVIVAAYLGYLGIQAQISAPVKATQTAEVNLLLTPSPSQTPALSQTSTIEPTPTQRIVEITPVPFDSSDFVVPAPTIGAQLNFSPESEISTGWFRRSPFDGIFMYEVSVERYPPSWHAKYSDGPSIPAESDICLMNMGARQGNYFMVETGPLNVKTSRISLMFSIYVDYRYTLEINDIDIIIAEFEPMKTDVQAVSIGIPGAGGQGLPFKYVQAMKIWVEGISNTVYKMDFSDFFLAPNNGVNVVVPIAMSDAGQYKFIIKVNGVATPSYAGDPAGKVSLTSNVVEYDWVRLNDPRDYPIAELKDMAGSIVPIELIPCP